VNVLQAGGAEDIGESGAANLVGDHLGGERQIVEQSRKLTRCFGVQLLLLDDEAFDCYD